MKYYQILIQRLNILLTDDVGAQLMIWEYICIQNSLMREVDELEDDNPVSLSIERRRGRFGRLTVHWSAYGSLDDIFPTSGVVRAAAFCF